MIQDSALVRSVTGRSHEGNAASHGPAGSGTLQVDVSIATWIMLYYEEANTQNLYDDHHISALEGRW